MEEEMPKIVKIGWIEYLDLDTDFEISILKLLDKKWKLFSFIFLVIALIFVIALSAILIPTQVSGCSEINKNTKTRDSLISNNDNCKKKYIDPFNKNLENFKKNEYFTSNSTATLSNYDGFVNKTVTNFKGFSDFTDLENYNTKFNYNKPDVQLNIENFENILFKQQEEYNNSKKLLETLESDVSIEKGKTENLKNLKNTTQNDFDIIETQMKLYTKNRDEIKRLIDNPDSKDSVLSTLQKSRTDLIYKKQKLDSQKIILNNQNIQNDNLINSLTDENKNLLNKIKDVDCSIYV